MTGAKAYRERGPDGEVLSKKRQLLEKDNKTETEDNESDRHARAAGASPNGWNMVVLLNKNARLPIALPHFPPAQVLGDTQSPFDEHAVLHVPLPPSQA